MEQNELLQGMGEENHIAFVKFLTDKLGILLERVRTKREKLVDQQIKKNGEVAVIAASEDQVQEYGIALCDLASFYESLDEIVKAMDKANMYTAAKNDLKALHKSIKESTNSPSH